MHKLFAFISFCLIYSNVFAGIDARIPKDDLSAPNVYIDCRVCDFNYVRTHVTFVNYVRNRDEAQVQVLITAMPTGSGGREYTMIFLGRKNFIGMDDTLEYTSKPSETWDAVREGVSRTLALGLIRYAARMPIAKDLFVGALRSVSETALKDRWDYWVFNTSVRGFLNGQALTSQSSWSGSVSVSRTTPQSKFLFFGSFGYKESNYTTNNQNVVAISRQKNAKGMGAISLDGHWSAGGIISAHSSTYDNKKEDIALSPEIEYDIFPYSEATMRQLRFRYQLTYDYSSYYAETIFDKYSDRLTGEGLSVILNLTQPWGTINAALYGANYFFDFSKNHLQLYTQISFPLVQGLSLNLSGAVSMIHDQLSLPQTGATADEILLQQTELATQYSYSTAFGLSYTFGSIYNNVVNPRLW